MVTVRQLIEWLQTQDQNLEVLFECCSDFSPLALTLEPGRSWDNVPEVRKAIKTQNEWITRFESGIKGEVKEYLVFPGN